MGGNLLAQLLVLFGIFATYSQYGFAQFQKSAGAGIQEAIKASASDQAEGKVIIEIQRIEIQPYADRAQRAIEKNWLELIHRSGKNYGYRNGKTAVECVIERTGFIRSMRIVQSSGQDDLDKLALRSIALSNQLPALPREYSSSKLKMQLTFQFIGAAPKDATQ